MNWPPSSSACDSRPLMPSRKKIDLQKVLASLNVTCPKCGRVSEPQDIKRVRIALTPCVRQNRVNWGHRSNSIPNTDIP
jgi:hypothetical protein